MLARSAYQTDADELAAACFPGKPLMAEAVHGSVYRIVCFLSSRPPKTRNISFTTALQKQTLRDIKCGEISRSYCSKGSFIFLEYAGIL